MANLLTLTRLLAALPFAWAMYAPDAALLAGALWLTAVATDLLDGPIARRRGTASPATERFDHTADFIFVTSGLAAAAARGALPALLPVLVAIAFLQYCLGAGDPESGGLRPSSLGRLNGILYFVPLAGDVLARGPLPGLATPARALGWALVATTLLSIGDRALRAQERPRRAPD